MYLSGDFPDWSRLRFEEHLLGCAACRRNLNAQRCIAPTVRYEHVEVGAVRLYVSGKLSPDRRRMVESHLVLCSFCGTRVEEVMDIREAFEAEMSSIMALEYRPRVQGEPPSS